MLRGQLHSGRKATVLRINKALCRSGTTLYVNLYDPVENLLDCGVAATGTTGTITVSQDQDDVIRT